MPAEVSNYVVESYVRLRKLSKEEEEQNKTHSYTSARTLLGVLRLAQALARLRYSPVVDQGDVDEALRLMEVSKESLYEDEEKDFDHDRSAVSKIYRLIRDMAIASKKTGRKPKRQRRLGKGPGGERDNMDDEDEDEELSLVDVRARVLQAGFTEAQLMETVIAVREPSSTFVLNLNLITFLFHSMRTMMSGCVWRTTQNYGSSKEMYNHAVLHRFPCSMLFLTS